MKLRKKLFIALPIVSLPIFAVVSCSSNSNNDVLSKMKNTLNNFISTVALSNDISSQVKIRSSYIENQTLASQQNLFNVLDDVDLLANVFELQPTQTTYENYVVNYSFSTVQDSFNQSLLPCIDTSKQSIVIPVLISLNDPTTNITVSKYVNLFTLDIVDEIVNSTTNTNYNGTQGKAIEFGGIQFQTVPKIMIENYLNLNLFSQSDVFMQTVRYNEENKNKWKNKTLTEVLAISNAIQSPNSQTDFYGNEYNYTISSSTFWQDDFKYARFFIDVSLASKGDQQINEDAKEIYGLNFTKQYTYVDKRYAFACPSSSDISTFVSKNQTIATDLASQVNSSPYLYAPLVRISANEADRIGAQGIVDRFESAQDFVAPASFNYIVLDDDVRNVSFEITSLEVDDSDENIVKINMILIVGTDKLKASSTFTKKFNIKTFKFV